MGSNGWLCSRDSTTAIVNWSSSGTNALFAQIKDAYCRGPLLKLDLIEVLENRLLYNLGPTIESICRDVVLTVPGSLKGKKLWSTGDTSFAILVKETGNYSISLKDKCIDQPDNVKVNIATIAKKIPNIFTPNEDGFNDNFAFEGCIAIVGSLQLKVYNRWGANIYETNDYKFDWKADGITDGLYYFQILNDEMKLEKTGWILVTRQTSFPFLSIIV